MAIIIKKIICILILAGVIKCIYNILPNLIMIVILVFIFFYIAPSDEIIPRSVVVSMLQAIMSFNKKILLLLKL